MREEDLTGKTFGYLTVLCRASDYVQPSGRRYPRWYCRCACGRETIVTNCDLVNKRRVSCGCRRNRGEHDKHTANREFAKKAAREWTRDWGKYDRPFEFKLAVTELRGGR